MVPNGRPESLGELRLRVPTVVGELDRLTLRVREHAERLLDTLPLETEPGLLLGRACRVGRLLPLHDVQRLGAAALLAAHDVDRATVDERHDPGARLRPLGAERRGGAPDGEEALLDGVLREALVAEHPVGDAVGDAADAVVELGQGVLVPARDHRHEGLVREVREVFAHRPGGRLQRSAAPGRRTVPRPRRPSAWA